MLLRDVLYFAILVISITAAAASAEKNDRTDMSHEKQKKIKKREAIILDDYSQNPYEYSHSPKVVYRKASLFRYSKPKSKYGTPKSKYGPPKVSRPQKKYKSKPIIKYGHRGTTYKRSKYRYGAPKPLHKKPTPYVYSETYPEATYGSPEPTSWPPEHTGWFPEPTGFGEPPVTYNQIAKVPKQTYGEPPSESYGAPLENTYQYAIGQEYSHDQTQQKNYYAGSDYSFSPSASAPSHWRSNYAPEQNYYDNNYELSQTQESYASVNEESQPPAHMVNHESITDDAMEQPEVYNPKPTVTTYARNSKKKPLVIFGRNKKTFRPQGGKIIVGGKYAEPPGRYVPKFQPDSIPVYSDDFSSMNNYMDSEMAGTAGSAVSSYVNYKNSNLAFSPQNLNDVFGIVD